MLIILGLTPLAYAQDELQSKIKSLGSNIGASVGEERSTAGGGRVQESEKGAIYWSPTTGARLVKSDALAKYKTLGAETGKLGYPVSDERLAGKVMSQTFEHGFLRTTADGGLEAEILSGVMLAEGSLTIGDSSGIILGIDDGFLNIREVSGPDIQLSCSCEANPSPTSQRLGICNLTLSKSRKTATCRNRDCNGSCAFEISQK
jgi:hypothetical protein